MHLNAPVRSQRSEDNTTELERTTFLQFSAFFKSSSPLFWIVPLLDEHSSQSHRAVLAAFARQNRELFETFLSHLGYLLQSARHLQPPAHFRFEEVYRRQWHKAVCIWSISEDGRLSPRLSLLLVEELTSGDIHTRSYACVVAAAPLLVGRAADYQAG